MTNEELDRARAEEALRIWTGSNAHGKTLAMIAARLAREGWTPPEPDVLVVREIAAKSYDEAGAAGIAREFRSGGFDKTTVFCVALAAYRAGRAAR